MFALSRGESLRPAHEQSSKTSRRSRERVADAQGSATPHHETRSNAAGGTQCCGRAETSFCRRRDHGPADGLLPFHKAWSAALVSFHTSSTIHSPSTDFAPVGSIVAACTSSVPPHTSAGSSLSGLGLPELTELTSFMTPKRRHQVISSSEGFSVKTRIGPTLPGLLLSTT